MNCSRTRGHRKGQQRLALGVLTAFLVVIGKDHDIAAREVLFTTGRDAITAAPEGEGQEPVAGQCFHVFLALGPIDRPLALFGVERIEAIYEGRIPEAFRLF